MRRGRPPYPDILTPREWQVLELLREGLTNEQIAERLGITERGARFHVSEILSKLYVSSREEAAKWRPPERRLPLLIPSWLLRGTPATLIAASLVLLAILAVGVAVMTTRGGGGGSTVSPNAGRDPDLEQMLSLAVEARSKALTALPDAELSLVGYSTANDVYTFRFSQPGTATEVSVLGPYSSSAPQRWEILQEDRPEGTPRLEALDLSALRHSPRAIAEAAEDVTLRPASNMGVNAWSNSGKLTWNAMAPIGENAIISCMVLDSDAMSRMTCVMQP